MEHASAERERLRARLADIEAENQRICDEYVAVQEQVSELAQLYVALDRLHGALSRADTLQALQEIVINVVGSEELAVFERRGDTLVVAQSFGLDAELALAREAVAHAQAERDRLRARASELEAENQRLSDEYVAVEERTTHLTQLYVALERLHGGGSRAETLAAVQEIVINLVGSEELAVFERRGGALALVHAFGVPPRALDALDLREGAIGRAAATGRAYLAGRDAPSPNEDDLTAAIPLRAWDGVQGVLAIFRLLGHKPGLCESDHAVFDLLSTHAGVALRLREPRPPAAG